MITNKQRPLTPEQEHFCRLYTSKGDFSKKGYKCYSLAYDIEIPLTVENETDFKSSEYKTCVASASRLLTQDYIQERIRDIYLDMFNDKDIDARLNEIVHQGKDTDSIQAIKIANDLKQRITKRIDITTAGRPLQALSDEDLQRLAE